MNKQANPVDVHVGARLRLRRMALGVSQEKLGEQLGVTFQQVQKYEKGANRIGASRLYQISRVLEAPIQYFFEDLPEEIGDSGTPSEETMPPVSDFVSTSEGLELNLAFAKIKDHATRKHLAQLVRSVAEGADRDE